MISGDFGWLAAAVPLAGFASYLRAMLRGRARPNKVSWSLWAAAPLIAFPAELAQGTGWTTALATLALGAGPALILAASFALPGAYWALTRSDLGCAAVAAAALAGWAATRQGDLAIALAIAADALAATPTIRKAYANPGSESTGTYAASGAGSAITLLTIAHWRFAAWAFPAYVVVACAIITAAAAAGSWAAKAAGRRERLVTACCIAAAAATLAVIGLAGFEVATISGPQPARHRQRNPDTLAGLLRNRQPPRPTATATRPTATDTPSPTRTTPHPKGPSHDQQLRDTSLAQVQPQLRSRQLRRDPRARGRRYRRA